MKGFNDVATDYEMLQHQAYLFATESSLQLKFLLKYDVLFKSIVVVIFGGRPFLRVLIFGELVFE